MQHENAYMDRDELVLAAVHRQGCKHRSVSGWHYVHPHAPIGTPDPAVQAAAARLCISLLHALDAGGSAKIRKPIWATGPSCWCRCTNASQKKNPRVGIAPCL